MKVCLLGVSFNTGNMGVGALSASLVRCARHTWPDCEINLLEYGQNKIENSVNIGTSIVPVKTILMRFSIKFTQSNNIAVLLLIALISRLLPTGFGRKLRDANRTLKEIQNNDIFASIAGGDSFSDIYGIFTFLYIALPQLLIILLGRKLIQMPQTYGPFNNVIAKKISKFILLKSDKIFSRDLQSIEAVQNLVGINKHVDFHHDVAFCLNPVKPLGNGFDEFLSDLITHDKIIGLNVSGLLYIGGYTKNNMFDLKVNYKKLIYDFISYFTEECKLPVLLIPHVYGGKENIETDVAACCTIFEEFSSSGNKLLYYYSHELNQNELKYLIGHCCFFAGSRMHACIAAISQGIPAVGLAYSRKFEGVFKSVGLNQMVSDLRVHDEKESMLFIKNSFNKREQISAELESVIGRIRSDLFIFDNLA